MQNEVFERKSYLSLDDCSYEEIEDVVNRSIDRELYSYFVGRKDDVIVIKTVVSTIVEFNTIDYIDARENTITSIVDYITSLSNRKCICFGQPPIELIVELYQPMIQKMATRLNFYWKQFEYDDLVSMGNMIMVQLYRKGYYLNKSLIWTSLNNEVLMKCRTFRHRPIIVSIDDEIKSDVKLDSEEISYGDIIEDTSYKEEEESKDERELELYIFEQVKSIVIDKVGQRQWDQFWRDYSKGHTTNTTRAMMQRLKGYFNELDLTRKDFINMYRR
jgi:hypothetical protein